MDDDDETKETNRSEKKFSDIDRPTDRTDSLILRSVGDDEPWCPNINKFRPLLEISGLNGKGTRHGAV
jgi:hypothetical protein